MSELDKILQKWNMDNVPDFKLELEDLIQNIRLEEVLKACYNWEKYPDLPATYLINRKAEIKKESL